jgi:glycosyltransferase involved in cell wall biosynthesis
MCAIVPAYEAAPWIDDVVRSLLRDLEGIAAVIVVDDGSHDDTAALARAAGADVVSHPHNLGKGCALRTGLLRARTIGCEVALSVDADGQHPSQSAREVLEASDDPEALVLGVRDLERAGCPKPSQRTNRIANFWITHLSGRLFVDTQCGLRRYPVERTLALATSAHGYAYESEMLLRAVGAGMTIVEQPIEVHYPPPAERLTHFKKVPDVTRITLVITNVGVQEFFRRTYRRAAGFVARVKT